ncbi:hypothetical protein L208DRAFT_1346930, partial [Tricholoma matsutake]
PTSLYNFDSECDSLYSEICRQGASRDQGCIIVCWNHSTETILCSPQPHSIASSQAHGFFCALPMDPNYTHIECRLVPK